MRRTLGRASEAAGAAVRVGRDDQRVDGNEVADPLRRRDGEGGGERVCVHRGGGDHGHGAPDFRGRAGARIEDVVAAGGKAQRAGRAGRDGAVGKQERIGMREADAAAGGAGQPGLAGVDDRGGEAATDQKLGDAVGDQALSDAVEGEGGALRQRDAALGDERRGGREMRATARPARRRARGAGSPDRRRLRCVISTSPRRSRAVTRSRAGASRLPSRLRRTELRAGAVEAEDPFEAVDLGGRFGERGLGEVSRAVEADAGLAAEGVAAPLEASRRAKPSRARSWRRRRQESGGATRIMRRLPAAPRGRRGSPVP